MTLGRDPGPRRSGRGAGFDLFVGSDGVDRDLPVSEANSQVVYTALKHCGIRLLSALPETWLVHLVALAEADADMTLVRLAKEEEGVGISAGAHLAGVKSAPLIPMH